MGLKEETKNIFEEFKKSGFKSNHELVTNSMLNSLCIAGSPEEAKLQLKKFRNAGIDLPIIQFNPIGDTIESFSLLKKHFWMKHNVKGRNNLIRINTIYKK